MLTSLRAVTIGSEEPGGTVYLNGKKYRGKMEVFVNSKGALTVVNVVPMEAYLLGVVPSELSLPQIEAQKAQAVAARTYAAANKDTYGDDGFDMLPTVWSQVYKGVSIETTNGNAGCSGNQRNRRNISRQTNKRLIYFNLRWKDRKFREYLRVRRTLSTGSQLFAQRTRTL